MQVERGVKGVLKEVRGEEELGIRGVIVAYWFGLEKSGVRGVGVDRWGELIGS